MRSLILGGQLEQPQIFADHELDDGLVVKEGCVMDWRPAILVRGQDVGIVGQQAPHCIQRSAASSHVKGCGTCVCVYVCVCVCGVCACECVCG